MFPGRTAYCIGSSVTEHGLFWFLLFNLAVTSGCLASLVSAGLLGCAVLFLGLAVTAWRRYLVETNLSSLLVVIL